MSINLWKNFFDDPFFQNSGAIFNTKQNDWLPHTDIKETENSIVFHSELPGLTLDDVHVEIHNGLLTMKGEKKREVKEEKENFHRVERHFGSFQRTFQLPEGTTEEHVSANLKNGVLEVTIQKVAPKLPAGPSRIQISQ